MLVRDKTIVVCGVGPGLGREVAEAALRDGGRVVIAARRAEALAEQAKTLDASGERVLAVPTDIADETAATELMDAAAERFGGVDAVVQVAALDTVFGNLESTPAEDWARVVQINVVGSMNVARAATPHMKKAGGGSIVLIGSQSMWYPPMAPQLAYASSKGALLSAMYYLAQELGPDGIRVNMVVPSWMWGPPVEAWVNHSAKERGVEPSVVRSEIEQDIALGFIPDDADCANAVVFLCSDLARVITGASLDVNGGDFMP